MSPGPDEVFRRDGGWEENPGGMGVVESPRDSGQPIPGAHERRGTMPVCEFVCRARRKKFARMKPITEYDPKKVTCP
jgi:hypothetical protein